MVLHIRKELYEPSFDEARIKSALTFLYKKGYITKDEYLNRKSERLNEVKLIAPRFTSSVFVVLFFDNQEWNLEVEVDNMLNITTVGFKSPNDYQVLLYERNKGE